MRHESDLGEVLDGFHLHVCVFERVGVGDDTVVRHQNRIVAGDEGFKSLRQFGSAGHAVAGERNRSQSDNDFTDKWFGKRQTGGGKSRGCWRMGVNDGLDIGTHAVDQQVHADFAGDVAAARDTIAVEVDDDQVLRAHGTLAHAGGSYQNLAVVAAQREISVHSRDESALMEHMSIADNLFPLFPFAGHESFKGSGREQMQSGTGIVSAPCGRNNAIYIKSHTRLYGRLRFRPTPRFYWPPPIIAQRARLGLLLRSSAGKNRAGTAGRPGGVETIALGPRDRRMERPFISGFSFSSAA